jgi:uridine kinase
MLPGTRVVPSRARDALDWRRLRSEALEPLRDGKPAKWRPFVSAAGKRPDGSLAMDSEYTEREPTAVIVLDGLFSTRPGFADLIDLSVLVDVPIAVQHRHLTARWQKPYEATPAKKWEMAEQYYFTQVRPASSFNLVVTTDDGADLTE